MAGENKAGKKVLFDFSSPSASESSLKEIKRYFQRAGVQVVSDDLDQKLKRSSDVTYREAGFAFADNQQVVLRIKQTGDVFQVLLNGTAIPIKNQDDHVKAVAEIVNAMDSKRTAFQKKLAATAVAIPPGIKTAAPTLLKALSARRDALKEAIAAVREELAAYQQPPATA